MEGGKWGQRGMEVGGKGEGSGEWVPPLSTPSPWLGRSIASVIDNCINKLCQIE